VEVVDGVKAGGQHTV